MDFDCGQVLFQMEELRLVLSRDIPEDAVVRLEVEMKGAGVLCKWVGGNDAKFTSAQKQLFKSRSVEANFEYVVGLSDVCPKSTYIPLTPANMLSLGALKITVQVILVGVKGAKDESLIDFTVSSSDLFASKSFSIDSSQNCFPNVANKAAFVVADESLMTWRYSMDSDMAEYCVGSMVIRFNGPAILTNPPIQFSLHYNDILDPKAKVQPTPADLRAKYLDNINKFVDKQTALCSFALSINDQPFSEGISSFLPTAMLASGSLTFDAASAASVPIEEDIRQKASLWSVKWDSTSAFFIHRTTKKLLSPAIEQNPKLSFSMTKTPSDEGKALEGEPTVFKGEVDVTSLLDGSIDNSIPTTIANSEASELSLNISLSEPIRPPGPSPKSSPTKSKPKSASSAARETSSSSSSSSGVSDRNVVAELNKEIVDVLRKIACEFVQSYPLGDKESNEKALAEKKSEFLHYLSTSSIYHELKETLKPRIQRVVELKFGPRMTQVSEDVVLSELYVYLTKQSNLILNSLYSAEGITMDLETVSSERKVENWDTNQFKLKKLLCLANDSEADGRFEYADQIHLERLQFVQKTEALLNNKSIVHGIYSDYAEFCLRQSSLLASHRKGRTDKDISIAKSLFDRAKEALSTAYSTNSDLTNWKMSLLHAAMFIEYDQFDKAEAVLNSIISGKNMCSSDNIVSSLEGYDTDRLVLADPLVYSVLSVLYSVTNKQLRLKKTLKLISKSFVACGCLPPVESHGSPRRTVVFAFATAAVHFSKYGLHRIVSTLSSLAQHNEAIISAKVDGIGRASATVPTIRYYLKRSLALSQTIGDVIGLSRIGLPTDDLSFNTSLLESSEKLLRDSILVSNDREDRLNASLELARVLTLKQASTKTLIDSLSNTIALASSSASGIDLTHRVPVQLYVQLSKLLFESGKLDEASTVALIGAKTHSSPNTPSSGSLMLLIGVCALRSKKWVDAEDALLEANTIDNRFADVWAYLCLNCIYSSKHRLGDAERSLFQAIRLGLQDTELLREIATAFLGSNKLQVAEDVTRRVVAMESITSETGKASFATRHLLGKILERRNLISSAIDEYQACIGDPLADKAIRIDSAKRCVSLVESLGRGEDQKTLNKILADLSGADVA